MNLLWVVLGVSALLVALSVPEGRVEVAWEAVPHALVPGLVPA